MNPLLPRLLLWLAFAVAARADVFTAAALGVILVLYPAATDIELGRTRALRRFGAVAGPVGAAAALLPPGPWGAALAAVWLAYAAANLGHGVIRFINARDRRDPAVWAHAVGHAGPVVGALAWVAARSHGVFAGFGEPIATLTVVHFHTVFGALPLALAAWTVRLRPDAGATRRVMNALLAALLIAPLALGVCFALRADRATASPAEAFAATAGALALAGWTVLAARLETAPTASALRTIGATALTAGYALGALWAASLAAGSPVLSFSGMALTHGTLNAGGLLLLTLTAARRARLPAEEVPAPDVGELPARTRGVVLFRDDITATLGTDTPAARRIARDTLLRYDVYPRTVLTAHAPFITAGRDAAAGDRIALVLRARLSPLWPEIRLPAVNIVTVAHADGERATLGYATTARHPGRGEWHAVVFAEAGLLKVRIRSTMTPASAISWVGLPLFRAYQFRARHAAITRLRERIGTASPATD